MAQIFTTFVESQCQDNGIIELRKEQLEAIKKAKERFKQKSGNKFLWNAKMRFGKTVCALQLAKELGYRRILIVTHRPTVNKEWLEAYEERFADVISQYNYGTKSDTQSEGTDFYTLKRKITNDASSHFLFFASMQYLRRSKLVGGDNDEQLKKDIMTYDWDLVIVDEAHEGTRTELGQKVLDRLEHKTNIGKDEKDTRMLHLSGTPFNLYDDFKGNEIFTWDYVDEQTAKNTWYDDPSHKGKPNPYAVLPHMNILTFNLSSVFDRFIEEGGTFKFKDFFRTKTGSDIPVEERGRFVHEEEVRDFIAKLRGKDDDNNFPFSTAEFRKSFRHTLWIVPGVKEAKALKKLLQEDKVFQKFTIVNVAGSGDDETKDSALDAVLSAITDQPDQTRTITLSCGKLTTGTTVKPWTAVLYLKGSEDTKAATYMQTIFRVQSPCIMGNMMKAECYVFDFDYQRTLKVVAETAKYSTIAKKASNKEEDKEDVKELTQDEQDKKNMKAFLDCCDVKPLVPFTEDGATMTEFNVESIFKRLEQVYVDRLVTSGFNDKCLYDMKELNKVDKSIIDNIGENGGAADHIEGDKRVKGVGEAIDANNLTEEQKKAIEEAKKKLRKEMEEKRKEKWDSLTQEQQDQILEERARKAMERKEFKDRVSNIRGISLRIPLLMFGGADKGKTSTPLTVDNFTRLISDESWKEFMPAKITKEDFNKIRKVFKATRFEEAGKKYRALAREADEMHIDERMERITTIHGWFKNPDKETVLTPWSVVNMHLNTVVGGYSFYDPQDFKSPVTKEVPLKDADGNEMVDEAGQTKTETVEMPVTEQPIVRDHITHEVFGVYDSGKDAIQTRILEINSKTGLYPLYMAYTLYRLQMDAYIREKAYDDIDNLSVAEEQATWDNVIRNNIFVICNTKMAEQITYRTLMGFRGEGKPFHHIRTTKLVERASKDEKRAELVKELLSGKFWGLKDKEMKFNAVVGNPPYMLKQDATSDTPIYHMFMELGFQLAPIATFITPGRFLFDAGKTPKEFNARVLNDDNFKVIKYEPDSTKFFYNVDIKGGIAITLRNANKKYGKIIRFTSHDELHSILEKVIEYNGFTSIDSQIYLQNKFNLSALLNDHPEYKNVIGSNGKEKRLTTSIFNQLGVFSMDKRNDDDLKILGLINNIRTYRYIPKKYIEHHENLYKYKVVIPASNGSGAIGEVLSTPILGEPILGYTQSFIGIGAFDTEEEASAALKYVKTKFMRTMLGILKVTQHNHTEVWKFVPLQDFTSSSDINWSTSVADIDQQLYRKYGLSADEIAFIEKMIKPME